MCRRCVLAEQLALSFVRYLHGMNHAMTILAIAFSVVALSAQAAVKCTCKTILADGEGNTSCSAAESNNRCTVDFNQFFQDRADRAFAMVRDVPGISATLPSAFENPVVALARAPEKAPVVNVYLMIAAASLQSRFPGTFPSSDVRSLLSQVGQQRQRIEEAFSTRQMEEWGRTPDANVGNFDVSTLGDVTIAPGCVEVSSGGRWVMFKAAWSPARVVPRCAR
jgi:hypothetical protein